MSDWREGTARGELVEPRASGSSFDRLRTSADALASIADLDLVARIIVDGLVSGPHRSPFHGYSAEFSQYRHYQPGDDLKYVDWKLAARTDRIYTKQFRETTNMAVSIVLDASASMAFPADERLTQKSQNTQSKVFSASSASSAWDVPPVSKFRYAAIVAAALAHLVSRQGDAVGLVAGGGADVFLPPRAGRQHLRRVQATLSSLRASGAWTAPAVLRHAAERLTRRGMLIALSDFYDGEKAAFAELRRAVRMGHDVAVFQIVSRTELEFPYARDLEFADLETGETLVINADAARRDYTDVVSAFVERCRKRATAEGIQYSLVVTETAPERTLRSFLLARQ